MTDKRKTDKKGETSTKPVEDGPTEGSEKPEKVVSTGGSVQLFQMLFLPCIPIVALIIQDCITMYKVALAKEDLYDSMNQVKMSVKYGKLLEALQAERSVIAYSVFNKGSDTKNLTRRFEQTNMALESMDLWPKFKVLNNAKLFNSRLRFRIRLEDFRKQVMSLMLNGGATDDKVISVVKWYNYANQGLLDQLDLVIKGNTGSGVWRLMIAYQNLLRALENLGISLVYGLVYYGRGVLSPSTFSEYVRYTALSEGYLNASANFAQFARGSFENVTGNYAGFEQLKQSRYAILDNEPINASMTKADAYYSSMEKYMEKLRSIQVNLRRTIIEEIEEIESHADQQMSVAVTVLVVVIAVAPILVMVMYRVTNTTQMFSKQLNYNTKELKREKHRVKKLLNQLLPKNIALHYKSNSIIVDVYESTTVYVSDIVGFLSLIKDSSPVEAVMTLNTLTKLIENRVSRYDVYKIETIRDVCMIVSGIPERNGTRHAGEIARMALDILHGVEAYRIPHQPTMKLGIRIGINSGSCVGGVVGTKMPCFCVFGDTLDNARKIERYSSPFQILVSDVTKAHLEESGGFHLEQRGMKDLSNFKGIGVEELFWLTGCDDLDPVPTEGAQELFEEYPEYLLSAAN